MSEAGHYAVTLYCTSLPLQGVEPLTAKELIEELLAVEKSGADLSLLVTPVLSVGPIRHSNAHSPQLTLTVLDNKD